MASAGQFTPSRGGLGRLSGAWDSLQASFGFLSGVAMVLGVAVGLGLPAIDEALTTNLPVLAFESQSSARSLLETIGTATVAVAGLSFSVTVVAFTLASSQLSPRVLRNFRGDRLSQVTLALFLGTFIYCLTLLVRLGVSGEASEPPNLSITLAVLLAFAAFVTFAGFIAHILSMLQPASVIDAIHSDAVGLVESRYPNGPGDPDDPVGAAALAEGALAAGSVTAIEAERQGYLTYIDSGAIIAAAERLGALVSQRVPTGTYVLPGQIIAEVWVPPSSQGSGERGEEELEELRAAVRRSITLGRQRTMVQDVAFPIRQLADIALKGLSPGINDPTTAENALDALSAVLVEFARSPRPAAVRVDADQQPRLLAIAPDLDDMVRLGFEQVRVFAGGYALLSVHLLELLDEVERAAGRAGLERAEIARQRRLIAAGIGKQEPTDEDIAEVRARARTGSGQPASE